MDTPTLEERVAALEAEMIRIKSQTSGERQGVWGRTDPQRIDEMFGIFADEPLFDHMVERMNAQRERERQMAEIEP